MPKPRAAKPKPKPIVPAERDVQAGVIEAAAMLGINLQRQNTGMATNPSGRKVRFGEPGNADLTGILPDGRRLEIEVKRPGKTPTDAQWHRIHEVNASNGCAFWIDSPEEALKVLRRLIEGLHIEIEPDGTQWVANDEPEPSKE